MMKTSKATDTIHSMSRDSLTYAMVVFEIITAEIPWERAKDADEVFDNVEIGGRPPFTPHPEVPEVLIQIMKFAWKQDPEERPSFSEIFEEFMKETGKTFIRRYGWLLHYKSGV